MYLPALATATTSAGSGPSWPQVILTLGILVIAFCVIVAAVAFVQENHKIKIAAGGNDEVRQLIDRYEQLAEKTMDAQQRVATDVAELRARTAAVEQILRSVE